MSQNRPPALILARPLRQHAAAAAAQHCRRRLVAGLHRFLDGSDEYQEQGLKTAGLHQQMLHRAAPSALGAPLTVVPRLTLLLGRPESSHGDRSARLDPGETSLSQASNSSRRLAAMRCWAALPSTCGGHKGGCAVRAL